ncbi:MAG: exodeoxyribonuclease VII large subunit, partial [Halobacteriovoraceae bacterium]|nr:exodeoxyribonuclease VII large subunit [Halobacteriovoraceae bacterium]
MQNASQSVTHVVNSVKNVLEGEFRGISVLGEVTNLSSSASGHFYFTLSDGQSSLSSALFKMDALRNPVIKKIKDGDKVVCHGNLGVYARRGTFQLITKQIEPVGKGDLKASFEKLKKQLAGEGLFDLEVKQKIPDLPQKVAVITALKGAALQDFLNIFKRRSQFMKVMVVPALVQGEAAPKSIRQALHNTIKFHLQAAPGKKIDVIVLTRGGGSLEDLWAFNDEALAWDIFNCPVPTISAIGHQVDFSISDFVADLRAETPSAAAEILTEYQGKALEKLEVLSKHLQNAVELQLNESVQRLSGHHPQVVIDGLYGRLLAVRKRLGQLQLSKRLFELCQFHEKSMRLDEQVKRLDRAVEERVANWSNRLEEANGLLRVMDPHNVLGRGYSFLKDEEGHV